MDTANSKPAASPAAATPAPAAPAGDAIASQYDGDADMREVIAEFVARLPAQIATINKLVADQNLAELRRTVHQLKGAGGGYGFAQITTLAAKAEQAVKDNNSLDTIKAQVDDLVALVRRVRGYDPASETRPASSQQA
jgi:HPt (histidine-containing phosphotransfer) domain-containing protein